MSHLSVPSGGWVVEEAVVLVAGSAWRSANLDCQGSVAENSAVPDRRSPMEPVTAGPARAALSQRATGTARRQMR